MTQLTAGGATLTLDLSAGGRASSLIVDGLELLAHDAPTAVGWGWYPMAPWAGRLRDNTVCFQGTAHHLPPNHDEWAIHGTVFDAAWTVDSLTPASAVLSARLKAPWPWAGRVVQEWHLADDHLETVLAVHADDQPFPAEVGWHPWFRRQLARGGPVQLELPVTQMYERADHLPTGRLVSPVPPGPYDDTFPLPGGTAGLVWPGALSLTCRTDCGYVVVYDQRPDGVCLEPQTAPPDGINTMPTVVRPGRPRTARAVWSWVLA